MIAVNGRIVAQGSQFSLNDVEVISATIDIEDVRSHRASSSRSFQAASAERYHRIEVPFALSSGRLDQVLDIPAAKSFELRYHTPEEEIACVFTPCPFMTLLYDAARLLTNCIVFQPWSSVLALGLSPSVAYTGLFHSS